VANVDDTWLLGSGIYWRGEKASLIIRNLYFLIHPKKRLM